MHPKPKAFKTLKTLMCYDPILIQPNFDKHFNLQADASAYGIGAILLQEEEHLLASLAK
jgi:hypothetical protein